MSWEFYTVSTNGNLFIPVATLIGLGNSNNTKYDIETDLHELPKGVYYLILSSDISTETVRVVKI